MNIDNGTSDDLKEGMEITISQIVSVVEIGGNYITVETEDGDEIDITDSSNWWVRIL
jgi:hypothetical protein